MNLYPAVLVGDPAATSKLASLTIQQPSRVQDTPHVGVVCDDGSAAASTILEGVTITGFGHDVLVATSNGPSGCNLTVTASTFSYAHTGIWSRAGPCAPGPSILLNIGAPSAPNLFVGMRETSSDAYGGPYGAGIELDGCVSRAIIQSGTFQDSDVGIYLADPTFWGTSSYSILGGHFQNIAYLGLFLLGSATVQELTGNTFENVAALATNARPPGSIANAILFETDLRTGETPQIVKARMNVLRENDNAIDFGPGVLRRPSDFGTHDSPGGNVFQCNSGPALGVPSGDIRVSATSGGDAGVLPFVGNTWDEAPPRVAYAQDAGPNGIDIQYLSLTPPILDTSEATATPPACKGRYP
jgi:hypothetical protein